MQMNDEMMNGWMDFSFVVLVVEDHSVLVRRENG